jgi:hypothetical protein
MDPFQDLFSQTASNRGRVATTEELTDCILALDNRTKAEIVVGAKVVLFDPDWESGTKKSPFQVVDKQLLCAADKPNCLDFAPVGLAILDRNTDIQEALGEELGVCMQVGRDRVVHMMNQVRAGHHKAPVIEPDIEGGAYQGTIVSQCQTQSVMMSEGRAVLLDHNKLESKPTPNSLTRVEFPSGNDLAKVQTIQREIAHGATTHKPKGLGKAL